MMAVTYSFLTLILCLLTGGGNDLLDYCPTESYWREKKVDVSFEAMVAELVEKPGRDVSQFIADLGSPDAATRDDAAIKIRDAGGAGALKSLNNAAESPDAEVRRRAGTLLRQIGGDEIVRGVRRLMAIRTLGELGKPEAVNTLKPLLQSKELFVAEYTRVALELIARRRPSSARAVGPRVAEDVWLLPKECRAVGQLVPRRGSPLGFAEFMAAARGNDQDRKNEDAALATRMVLSLAEQLGNIRIDGVTFGLAGNPVAPPGNEENGAFLTVIVRARYDSGWARMLARSEKVVSRHVDGMEVFEPDGDQRWLMPSDDLFVFMSAANPDLLPLNSFVAGLKKDRGTLADDDAMRQLVDSIDTKQVLWAAVAVDGAQRALPVVGAFSTMTLVGTREGKTLRLKLSGRGSAASQVKAAVEQVTKHTKMASEFLDGIKGHAPITMAVELLNSARMETDGLNATLTAKLETTPAAILSLPMLYESADDPDETPAHPRLRNVEPAAK